MLLVLLFVPAFTALLFDPVLFALLVFNPMLLVLLFVPIFPELVLLLILLVSLAVVDEFVSCILELLGGNSLYSSSLNLCIFSEFELLNVVFALLLVPVLLILILLSGIFPTFISFLVLSTVSSLTLLFVFSNVSVLALGSSKIGTLFVLLSLPGIIFTSCVSKLFVSISFGIFAFTLLPPSNTFISGLSFDEGSGSFGFVQTFKLSCTLDVSFFILLLTLLSSGITCEFPKFLYDVTLLELPPNCDALLLFPPLKFSLGVPSSELSNSIVLSAPTLIDLASLPAAIATDIGGL